MAFGKDLEVNRMKGKHTKTYNTLSKQNTIENKNSRYYLQRYSHQDSGSSIMREDTYKNNSKRMSK